MGGEKDEERFIPAPFDHAKASVIRALPAVAARPEKDEGNHLEAKIDVNLWAALKNTAFGSGGEKGNAAIGTLHIDLAGGTKDGVTGTTLKVSFSKHGLGSGRYAAPLLDETACLASLLSPNDPSANPTGSAVPASSSVPADVPLAAGQPVKVALRNYLYTGDFPKKTSTVDVVLQVIDDVQADGVVVVRRGALAKGKITGWNGPKSYGRGGSFKFVVESVTAVDGQDAPLAADAVQEKGATKGDVARTVALGGLLGGFMTKGPERPDSCRDELGDSDLQRCGHQGPTIGTPFLANPQGRLRSGEVFLQEHFVLAVLYVQLRDCPVGTYGRAFLDFRKMFSATTKAVEFGWVGGPFKPSFGLSGPRACRLISSRR